MLFGIGLIVAFGVALAARLVPLLRGGGLYALGNYDDGVHFAAAMGVIHDLRHTATLCSCTRPECS
jgi:hypothetical protein